MTKGTNLENKARRRALTKVVGYGMPFSVAIALMSQNTKATEIIDNTNCMESLISALRAMNNTVCDAAAESIETTMKTGKPVNLHLRNAGLTPTNIAPIETALLTMSASCSAPLASFSVSYNELLGDAGAVSLAKAMPPTLQDLGFVGCNIHDEGGQAILEWAKNATHLKMICIENNPFTAATKSLYREFAQSNTGITVFI